jgi:hypothetical protein
MIFITFEKLRLFCLQFAFLILLILKLSSPDSLSWFSVFIPFWLWGGHHILSIIFAYIVHRRIRTPESLYQVFFQCIRFLASACFVFVTIGLLIWRLTNTMGSYPTTAVILIPFFIIVGILFLCCCCCCCLPLTFAATKMELEEELRNGDGTELVPIARRIENRVILIETSAHGTFS